MPPKDDTRTIISIDRRGKSRGEEGQEESKLEQLFKALGGRGKIQVRRRVGGKLAYVGYLDGSDDIVGAVEEALISRWGGGEFQVRGYLGDKYLGEAEVVIDERVHPVKTAGATGTPAAPAGMVSAEVAELRASNALMRVQLEALQRAGEQRVEDTRGWAGLLFKMQSDSQATQLALFKELALASRAQQPVESGLKQFREVTGVFRDLNLLKAPGSDDGGGIDKRSMLERVTEKPLEHAADRLVEKFFPTTPAPAATHAPSSSPAPAPSSSQPAAAAAKEAAKAPPKIPPTAKPLSPQDVTAAMARARSTPKHRSDAPAARVDEMPKVDK